MKTQKEKSKTSSPRWDTDAGFLGNSPGNDNTPSECGLFYLRTFLCVICATMMI